jgi:4-hydroxy-2-oxoheptanedioate aldolase
MNRACGFGPGFGEYFKSANSKLLTIIQIESQKTMEHIDEIAAVDGVDVLFIGPLDLTVSLGVPQQPDHPLVRDAFAKVVRACRKAGKAAGLMLMGEEQIGLAVADGFTVLAVSSDGGLIVNGMRKLRAAFQPYKK